MPGIFSSICMANVSDQTEASEVYLIIKIDSAQLTRPSGFNWHTKEKHSNASNQVRIQKTDKPPAEHPSAHLFDFN